MTHPYVVDWSEKIAGLIEMAIDHQPWYEQLATELVSPTDRVAVDIGCGGGGMTLALAAMLGGGGRVIAVDTEPQVLAAVGQRIGSSRDAADRPLARLDLVTADLAGGVGPIAEILDRPADLVWASASVHHLGDQQAAIDALASLLNPGGPVPGDLGPGGRLALAEGGLGARRLPWDLGIGDPGLELRLEAAHDRWFTRMRAELPGSVRMPYGWPEALRRAGLSNVTTRTVLRERPTPLPEPDRTRVVEGFGRSVERLGPTGLLDGADLAAWERLLDPADEAYLGRRDDLYRLDARSIHLGTRPGSPRSRAPEAAV